MLANSCRPRCKNLKAIGQAPTQLADVSWQMVLLSFFKTNWCFFVSQHIDDACNASKRVTSPSFRVKKLGPLPFFQVQFQTHTAPHMLHVGERIPTGAKPVSHVVSKPTPDPRPLPQVVMLIIAILMAAGEPFGCDPLTAFKVNGRRLNSTKNRVFFVYQRFFFFFKCC